MAKKWEYKAIRFKPPEELSDQYWGGTVDEPALDWYLVPGITDRLNTFGHDGWELVGLTAFHNQWYSMVLKRPA